MTPEQKQTIRTAIEEAQKAGITIRTNGWGLTYGRDGKFRAESGEVCPLGAVLLGKENTPCLSYRECAAMALQTTTDEVAAFIYGVDGEGDDAERLELVNELTVDALAFGKEIRETINAD